MKGVLIGTDYLEKGDEVKILEINTNTAMFNTGVEMLDLTPLFNTVTSNNIKEFHYIFTEDTSALPLGNGNKFLDTIQYFCNENNIEFFEYQVGRNSVTVPYIEDDDYKFILRQAYDTYAIIDSLYTSDKIGFFSMMSGSSYIPKTYFSSSEDYLFFDSIDTLDFDNLSQPNLIQKDRYPSYSNSLYPKISILPNLTSLEQKKQNISENQSHLLQEFIYDEKNIVDGYYSVIRTFDIIYGGNLDVINLGGYRQSSPVPLSFCDNNFIPETFDLDSKSKTKYLNKYDDKGLPIYHTDLESLIWMANEELKRVDEITDGDVIQSVTFGSASFVEHSSLLPHPEEEKYDLEYLSSSLQWVSSSLVSKKSQVIDTLMVKMTLDNGEELIDTPTSTLYIEESGSNQTMFTHVNGLYVGDKVVIINKDRKEISSREIVNLEIVHRANLQIFNLDFEPYDYFLVDKDSNEFMIMHNECRWCGELWAPCGNWACTSDCPGCGRPPQK
jgi:hypothetical protein